MNEKRKTKKSGLFILLGALALTGMIFAFLSGESIRPSGSEALAEPAVSQSEVHVMDFSNEPENVIYLAGGCFWGMQKFFDQFDGVVRTETGYANGPDQAPTYQDVCADSGHAETVKIVYDESRISLTDLLGYYFMVIDPLSVNRQGNDRGVQYRTGIYYTEEDQLPEIEAVYRAQEEKAGAKLAVELMPLVNFFTAEAITLTSLNLYLNFLRAKAFLSSRIL